MSTVPSEPTGSSDAELITTVRGGDLTAYGTLYERHVGSARNLARQLARSSAEADDLVADAFAKVLDTLRTGKGPDSAFRAYLLTALRHAAYDKTRKDRRVDLNEDMTAVSGELGEALSVPFSDTAVAGFERSMAAKAFAQLPERWQAVLWHTEIEQQPPAEVAPLLGLSANGVSALAYRAREGLRQAYLQVHLAETSATRCRSTADRLGAWTRDGLSKRERSQVESHLDECEHCRTLAAELSDVNGALRAVIAPLVLGGAALGYLAEAGASTASAATAGAAAATSASAASGASGAGAAVADPRQFLGLGASAAAVVAAVAVGLASGGGQEIPQAEQPSGPVPQQEEPPAEDPPADEQPEDEQPEPDPPADEPPADEPAPPDEPADDPADEQEPPGETPEAPEPQPAPDPAPGPADIILAEPPEDLELTPGQGPEEVPITVRNDGESTSGPITTTLTLPDGVVAEAQNGGGSQPAGGGSQARSFASTSGHHLQQQGTHRDRIRCPAGEGTISCSTPEGLEPDESATMIFRLSATEGADGDEITGTIDSGTLAPVSITIPVRVPEPQDGVVVTANPAGQDQFAHALGRTPYITVDNIGQTSRPVTLIIDTEAAVFHRDGPRRMRCVSGEDETTCTTRGTVESDEQLELRALLTGRCAEGPVTITARLGEAQDQDTVDVGSWVPRSCPPADPTEQPTEPSTHEPTGDPSPVPAPATGPSSEPTPGRSTGPAPESVPHESGSPAKTSTTPNEDSARPDTPSGPPPEPTDTTTAPETTDSSADTRPHSPPGHAEHPHNGRPHAR